MEHLLRTSRLDFSGILGNSMAVIKTGAARLIPLALLSAIPQAIMLTLTQANYFSQSSSDSLAPLCALCGLDLVFFVLIMFAYIAQAYTVEASSPPKSTQVDFAVCGRLPVGVDDSQSPSRCSVCY